MERLWATVLVGILACAEAGTNLRAGSKVNATSKPNLLLLFPDQWRYDWDGLTDEPGGQELPLHMPTVKGLAQKGVRFTQAYVPAPVCAPSRSCLASGREYDRTGVRSNSYDFPKQVTTIYSLLQSAGYHTMVVGKDDLTKGTKLGYKERYHGCPNCKDGDGLYRQAELGFDDGFRTGGKMDVIGLGPNPWEMYGFYLRNHTVVATTGEKQTAWDAHLACNGKESKHGTCDANTYNSTFYQDDFTAMNAIKLLQRRPAGKPFFMQVNFPGPHDPFVVTAPMHDSVSDGRVWPQAIDDAKNETPGGSCTESSVPSRTRSRCNYAAELENLDQLFQKILKEVEKQGELDRTIIFVASDHGEMLGDHGEIQKSKPWQAAISVPLIVVGAKQLGPKILAAHEVHRPVATLDLAGTLLDFAGAELESNMTTLSLRTLLTADGAPDMDDGYRPFVSSGLDNFRLAVKQIDGVTYKYICCHGKCPEAPKTAPPVAPSGWMEMLINVDEDKFDMKDLSKELPEIAKDLRHLLPTDAYDEKDFVRGCATIRAEEL